MPETPLARITSPELTQAQLAYLRASSRTVLAQKAAERAHHLLAADVIAVAEVERRESELEVARAELEAAKDQLRLLGVDSQCAERPGQRRAISCLPLPSKRQKADRYWSAMSSSGRSCSHPISYSRWPTFPPSGWWAMCRSR